MRIDFAEKGPAWTAAAPSVSPCFMTGLVDAMKVFLKMSVTTWLAGAAAVIGVQAVLFLPSTGHAAVVAIGCGSASDDSVHGDSRCNGSTQLLGAWFAEKIGWQKVFWIRVFELRIAGRGGVVLAAIQADIREVFEAATFDAAVFGTIAKDDVAGAGDTCVAVGIVQGIGIA